MSARSAPRRTRTGTARDRAADALVRVETEGAFAAPVLAASLARDPALSAPDRALTTELVYGVLRCAPALDARLGAHAPRAGSISKLDPYSRAVLRIAAYQILALARIPTRAAVHAAVDALKRDRSPGLSGFANAVLRKLGAERPENLPENARSELALASVPARVIDTIALALGSRDDAMSVLRAAYSGLQGASLRANTLRGSRDELRASLLAERPGATVRDGSVSPWSLWLGDAGDPRAFEAYARGMYSVQEEGAQCVALATGARPGMSVLDACAGRGGKTTALAQMMAREGVLHAAEMYPEKVARIAPELARLGLTDERLRVATAAVDLSRGLGSLTTAKPGDGYDVVLVDAPCSGLGTLARRPDIALRTRVAATSDDASDVADASEALAADAEGSATVKPAVDARVALPALQRAILERVAPLVKVGGVLVYAVCTLARDEGPGVVEAFRAAMPGFEPAEGDAGMPERLRGASVVLRPDRDGTDGFMVFRLRRRG